MKGPLRNRGEDKSRLCMMEFSKLDCESLHPNEHCQKLMDCVQNVGQEGIWTKTRQHLSIISEEEIVEEVEISAIREISKPEIKSRVSKK